MRKTAVVNKRICVACGACMSACPRSAVRIISGCYASVDSERCVGCGLCGKSCPANCIEAVERGVVYEK